MSAAVSKESLKEKARREAELILRISQKDKSAFATFFELYAVRVKAFLIRYGVEVSDADDLAQDVMVQVWRKASTFNPQKASASTWVFTIARNRRIDRIRKIARAKPLEEDPLFQPDPEPDALTTVAADERDARVKLALAALSQEQRQVIEASFFAGLSHAEVSEVLKIPLGTVKSRTRLAFKSLRAALGDDMVEELLDV